MSDVYADDLFTFDKTNIGNCGTAGSTCIAMTQCVLPTVVCLRVALPMSDVYANDSFTFDETNVGNLRYFWIDVHWDDAMGTQTVV